MERRQIIYSLLNAEKEDEIIPYLNLALDQLPLDKSKLTIRSNSDFSFITEMYPNVTFEINKERDPYSLYFKKVENKENSDLLTHTFSFYKKKIAEFNFGLGKEKDGVFVEFPKPSTNIYQFNPYYICLSDDINHIQKFLNNIKESSDVFIQLSSFSVLPYLDFKLLSKRFDNIEIYNKDQTITSVSSRYSENPKILRFKVIEPIFTDFYLKCEEILIDTSCQMIINMLYYTDKKIWSTIPYKATKSIRLAKEVIKERMDRIIKLGIILPKIKDVIDIILDKKDIHYKIKKLNSIKS